MRTPEREDDDVVVRRLVALKHEFARRGLNPKTLVLSRKAQQSFVIDRELEVAVDEVYQTGAQISWNSKDGSQTKRLNFGEPEKLLDNCYLMLNKRDLRKGNQVQCIIVAPSQIKIVRKEILKK